MPSSSPGIQFRRNGSSKTVIAIAKHARRFRSDESGSTAIEYGLIASVMGIMLVPTMSFFSGTFSDWATQLTDGFMTVMGF